MNTIAEREAMISHQLIPRGIQDPRVLDAFRAIPREDFLPEGERGMAYEDSALPIEHGQTASQPYVTARMVELLQLPSNATALEIGTGTGFQTAILAHVAKEVFAIEWFPDLSTIATRNLLSLGFTHVEIRHGDGLAGWPEKERKFDGILISFATPEAPNALLESLKPGGRLVAPIGNEASQFIRVYSRRVDGGYDEADFDAVRFLPRQLGTSSE